MKKQPDQIFTRPADGDYICRKCGNVLGKEIYLNGEIGFLEIGGGVLREARGNCKQCAEPFYYSVSEKRLNRLFNMLAGLNDDHDYRKISPGTNLRQK